MLKRPAEGHQPSLLQTMLRSLALPKDDRFGLVWHHFGSKKCDALCLAEPAPGTLTRRPASMA